MERYIGLDAHATSCTFAVVGPTGKRLRSEVVETNGRALVEFVRSIPRPRHLCLEEGTQSAWLYELFAPHVDEVVVAGVSESRGPKDDARDAFSLAERLRLGAIETRVFKDPGSFSRLRELARVYGMLTTDSVRVRNRLKAMYRSRGVAVTGRSVYGTKQRDEWLSKLPLTSLEAARTLYAELDALVGIHEEAHKSLVAESHRHPVSRILETCPGLGPIRIAQILPIVVTPHRFRTSRQFWAYCGLGIVMRSSSDWVRVESRWVRSMVKQTRGLNWNYNRTLKSIFKGAATTVITVLTGEPLREKYERLLAQGTKPNLAKVTIARKVAAITLAMWKHEEVYDPKKYRPEKLSLA